MTLESGSERALLFLLLPLPSTYSYSRRPMAKSRLTEELPDLSIVSVFDPFAVGDVSVARICNSRPYASASQCPWILIGARGSTLRNKGLQRTSDEPLAWR